MLLLSLQYHNFNYFVAEDSEAGATLAHCQFEMNVETGISGTKRSIFDRKKVLIAVNILFFI